MSAQLVQPRKRWWEGDGSPGIVGYLLADLVAVAAVALVLPAVSDFSGGIGGYLSGVVLVGFFASLYSIPLAAVGIPIVHFCCLRVRSQWVHVVAAGLVGFAAAVVSVDLLGGDLDMLPGLFLGAATAIGRAAVIPLALERQS